MNVDGFSWKSSKGLSGNTLGLHKPRIDNWRAKLQKEHIKGAPMSGSQIDFWFTMGSTYSYLSVMRLAKLEQSTRLSFRWRPFHLLIILQEMKHIPFADKPAKSAYMWRDIERRAAMYGISVKLPAPYPAKQSVMANLVAIVGMQENWGPDFVRAAYRRWFQLGQETGSEPNVSESLRDIGQDPARVFSLASSADANAALTAETNAARELGIFGSPTFAVGRELFWGDDRLEDAISWCRFGRVKRG
jgi:2-hydroxychromene-2-carboxylate isomerase